MTTNNSSNNKYTNNSDGFTLGGGTTERDLTVTGGNVTLTGSGSNTYTMPASSDTLVGRASADTLTNKTINAPDNTITNVGVSNLDYTTLTPGFSQTSTTITYTTTPTTLATATVTVPTGISRIKLTLIMPQIYSSVNSDRVEIAFKDGSTEIQRFYVLLATSGNPSAPSQYQAIISSPTTGSHTFSVSSFRDIGSGTITVYAGSSTNSYIQFIVEAC